MWLGRKRRNCAVHIAPDECAAPLYKVTMIGRWAVTVWPTKRSTVDCIVSNTGCTLPLFYDSWVTHSLILIQRVRSVQNAAARLIYSIRRSEHITDALISLHWLRVQERIVFITAVSPDVSSSSQHCVVLAGVLSPMCQLVAGLGRHLQTNSPCRHIVCIHSERGSFRLPAPASGTVRQLM